MSLDVYLEIAVDTGGPEPFRVELYTDNVTHNLNTMAEEAGCYQHLWHPEQVGITTAGELIEPLGLAIARMKADPDRFKALNPPNGWGSYDGFVPWIERYMEACHEHPKATVKVWG